MAITYFPDDVTVLGGDLVLGNTGLSPATGTPLKGTLTIQPAGNTTAGELYFQSKTGAGTLRTTTFKGSTSSAADQTYILPVNYPGSNGYSLTSTTAGVLSWTNVSGGGGGGVTGSGTDNHIARWDGTADIQDSGWVITDADEAVLTSGGSQVVLQPDGASYGSGAMIQTRTSGAGAGYTSEQTGDSTYRFGISESGLLAWGDGAGAQDVSLSRGAANRLDLASGDAFVIGSTAGDHASTTNGTISYNSTSNKFRAYENGAWADMIGGGSGWDGTTALQTTNGASIDSGLTAADTFKLRGRATVGGVWQDLLTVTSQALAATIDAPQGITWASQYIYHAGGTDVPITDGGTGKSTAPLALEALGGEPGIHLLKPVGNSQISVSATTTAASDTGYVHYAGVAPRAIANGGTLTIRTKVITAWVTAGTTPWCEVALLTGSPPALGGNPSLTVIGTLAIASAAGTGIKDYIITLTAALAAGTNIWIGWGSKCTTTRMVWRGMLTDELGAGDFASKTSMGPFSSLGAGTAFTANGTDTPLSFKAWI